MTLPKDPIKAEEYRKRQSETTKKFFKDPKNREAASERKKKAYEDDPTLIEKNRLGQIKRFEDPEQRRLAGLIRKGVSHTEETKKKMSGSHMGEKNYNFGKRPSEETIEKLRVAAIKQFEDPNQRKILSDIATERMKNPENRRILSEANKNKHPTEETRKKMSGSHKGRIGPNKGKTPTDETRKKISIVNSKENHYNWKGGVSCLPYCPKFDKKLKINVRQFFGNKCVICGKTSQEDNNVDLAVHHVFTEKMACCETKIEEMDSVRKRLPKGVAKFGEDKFTEEEIMYIRMMVPLCRSCHGKQNNSSENKVYEETKHRKFFVELILNKYNGKCYSGEK